jgi:hypothetical protein
MIKSNLKNGITSILGKRILHATLAGFCVEYKFWKFWYVIKSAA